MSDQYTSRNRVSLVYSGEDYFSLLLKLIEHAKYSIHLQVYIFDTDETGLQVLDALKNASNRGVAVFLHIDGYASQKFPRNLTLELLKAGVQFKFFEPILKSSHFYFGRRLHHKVFVADGLFSLVGGINVSNRYNSLAGSTAWLDVALYCEGEASYQAHQICRQLWKRKTTDPISKDDIESFCNTIPQDERQFVRVRRNDWVKRKSEVWNTYRSLFRNSKKSITIMSSYFLPGRLFLRLLSKAVLRGVQVRVILAGQSDVMLSKHAERYLYDYLLKKNIEIYEYQPTVLHGKITVCDGEWVTVGSFNVNNISAYASLEFNMDVKDRSFGNFVEDELSKIISENCIRITPENYKRSTNVFKKLWQKISYSIVNAILTLFTFYFKQEE
jgi:cardiolipin synthase A/B